MMSIPASVSPAERTIRRKVTASGVIWLDGRSYYVSRRLSGRTIPITIDGGRLIVDTSIPLRKEYSLPNPGTVTVRSRGWRSARRAG